MPGHTCTPVEEVKESTHVSKDNIQLSINTLRSTCGRGRQTTDSLSGELLDTSAPPVAAAPGPGWVLGKPLIVYPTYATRPFVIRITYLS